MKTVDLGDMFNESVIGLGNSLLQAHEPPEEQTYEMSDPYAIEDAGPAEVPGPRTEESMFARPQVDPFSLPERAPTPTVARATPRSGEGGSAPVVTGDLTSFVKGFEGYNPNAYNDYKQMSIGYGTRAKPGEKVISRDEAERRLGAELSKARQRVQAHATKHGYQFSENQMDALTSFDYNTGRISQLTNGGTRPPEVIGKQMLLYNKAGGEVLPGLVRRRKAESSLFQTP